MGCQDIKAKRRQSIIKVGNQSSSKKFNDNNNFDYEQKIKLLKQRYEYKKNNLKFYFEGKIKEIEVKYNNSKKESENEYIKIRQDYALQYTKEKNFFEFKMKEYDEFHQKNNDKYNSYKRAYSSYIKAVQLGNNQLNYDSKQEIKNRMMNHLNTLINEDFKNKYVEYNNKEEIKENYNEKQEIENYKIKLEQLEHEYQNKIMNLEKKHKDELSNLEDNFKSQKQLAIIENDKISQKLNDYYNGIVKATEIYERMNRNIEDKENNNDNFNLYDLNVIEKSDNYKLNFEQEECLICLGEFKNGEKLAILKCKHCYHEQCIKDWIIKKKGIFCPLCQAIIN